MDNKSMERKLQNGEALDVRKVGKQIAPGRFQLRRFVEDVDYCDAEKEEWIWSIGKAKSDGAIIASTCTEYYQNPEYECLWLR